MFVIANYWMQIFSLPKRVISHIEGPICRNILWTWRESPSRKAPISWEHTCDHVSAGGRNMISLTAWNKITIGKLLWNVYAKEDKLSVRWIHMYYIKRADISIFKPVIHYSWILKTMFKHRNVLV